MDTIKTKITRKIQDFEFYQNGFKNLSGVDVIVKNVRLLKKLAKADITFCYYEDNYQQKYFNCIYPYKMLGISL